MGTSPLARTGEVPPVTGRGHGTAALGPSDRSDSGSDVTGGPGLGVPGFGDDADARLGLDTGTTSDPATGGETSGPELGDADLDSDTDSAGTGERSEVGRERMQADGSDIGVDRIVGMDEAGVTDHPPEPWEDDRVDEESPTLEPPDGIDRPRTDRRH